MKILRIIATMNPKSGGPCQGIRNIIPAQKIYGIENEVLSFDSPWADFLNNNDFKIHAIGPAPGPYAFCSNLNKWLSENFKRFDVAIIHGLWLYNSYGTYKFWKLSKKQNKKVPKLYVMPHGMLDPYFQRARSRRFKAIRNWIFWKLIENQVVNGVDGMLFTCKQELLLARETFRPYNPKKELNAGYGIPRPPGKNIKSYWAFLKKCPKVGANNYWLFLSRIHPKKGVDLLIKAYLRLKQKSKYIPDLVIAGPGLETSYGKKILEMSRDESIHFTGMLEGKAKWAALHYCKVFILPSHQENFGIAVVEALACSKPVLITKQINIWNEILAGNGGIISEDTEEGVYKMLKYWSRLPAAEKTKIGNNALKVFREKFAVEKTALKMIECLNSSNNSEDPSLKSESQILVEPRLDT